MKSPADGDNYRRAERAMWDAAQAHPTESTIELSRTGSEIRIQEIGDGPPVVFVHGASNAGTSWAPLAGRLGDFRCILVDRPGCGLSPPLDGRFTDIGRLAEFADNFVVDVFDALGLDIANVVGTSFGGYFTLRAAAAHPERIATLTELSWTFGAPVESVPLIMRIATQPLLARLMVNVRPSVRMVRSLLKQIGLRRAVETGRFGDVEIAWFLSLLRDTDTMRNEIDSAPRIITMRGFNDETRLPPSLLGRVTAPTYLLWGEDDPMGGPTIARQFVKQLPHADLELMTGAGHTPWIDDPEHVADRVGAFLRTASRT